jgi:hypothetical protein
MQEIIERDGTRHEAREPRDPLQFRIAMAVQAHLWSTANWHVVDRSSELAAAISALTVSRHRHHGPPQRVLSECTRLVQSALRALPGLPYAEEGERAFIARVRAICLEEYYRASRDD